VARTRPGILTATTWPESRTLELQCDIVAPGARAPEGSAVVEGRPTWVGTGLTRSGRAQSRSRRAGREHHTAEVGSRRHGPDPRAASFGHDIFGDGGPFGPASPRGDLQDESARPRATRAPSTGRGSAGAHAEGLSTDRISELFGVSRQRVSVSVPVTSRRLVCRCDIGTAEKSFTSKATAVAPSIAPLWKFPQPSFDP